MAIPARNSDRSRIISGTRTFFVTSSIAEKRSLLQSERSASLFVSILCDYRSQGKFRLHEFVVMPDHFHLLLTVGSDLSIERAVQFIKGGFAFHAGRDFGFRSPVWQKGFSEVRVSDAGAYEAIRKYIHHNPVTRGLVRAPAEFPCSSAHQGVELGPPPQGLKPAPEMASERHG